MELPDTHQDPCPLQAGISQSLVFAAVSPTSAAGSQQKARTCWLLEALYTAEGLYGSTLFLEATSVDTGCHQGCSARLLLLDDQLRYLREHNRDSIHPNHQGHPNLSHPV